MSTNESTRASEHGTRRGRAPVQSKADGTCVGILATGVAEMCVTTPPYSWATPMLTGWDLQPGCPGDEHVAHAGARILDWRYERNPGDSNGTLIYTVKTDFGDADDFPGMRERVQVDVLGIDPVEPTVVRYAHRRAGRSLARWVWAAPASRPLRSAPRTARAHRRRSVTRARDSIAAD